TLRATVNRRRSERPGARPGVQQAGDRDARRSRDGREQRQPGEHLRLHTADRKAGGHIVFEVSGKAPGGGCCDLRPQHPPSVFLVSCRWRSRWRWGILLEREATMQFLTVSDEVVPAIYSLSIKERFGGIQAVLGCGDLPPYYLEFIVTMLAVPCF